MSSAGRSKTGLPAEMVSSTGEVVYGLNRVKILASFYSDPLKPTWIFNNEFKAQIDSEMEDFLKVAYTSLNGKNMDLPFSVEEIQLQIDWLAAGKAAGADGFKPYMLKWAPEVCRGFESTVL